MFIGLSRWVDTTEKKHFALTHLKRDRFFFLVGSLSLFQ